MGLRFRRRLTIFPGLRLNFTGTGISATLGVPGANININKDGIMHTLGAPGTGIHYRGKRAKWSELLDDNDSPTPNEKHFEHELYLWQNEEHEIKTNNNNLTTDNLLSLKNFLLNSLEQKSILLSERYTKNESVKNTRLIQIITSCLIIGLPFYWHFSKKIKNIENDLATIDDLLDITNINLDIADESSFSKTWNQFLKYFENYLVNTKAIWDITHSKINSYQEQIISRTNATETVNRVRVKFHIKESPIVKLTTKIPFLENSNGDNLYFLPGFILIYRNKSDIELIDFKNIHLLHEQTKFAEAEGLVSDAQVVGQTWTYLNKNGSPDRRFSNNPTIPICLYSELIITSDTGLNELYQFSNPDVVKKFVEIFNELKSTLHDKFLVNLDENISNNEK